MYTVKGIERVDYTNKAGNHVTGHRLHTSFVSDKVDGEAVEVIYCPGDCASAVCLGDNIDVLYNRFGKVSEVRILD